MRAVLDFPDGFGSDPTLMLGPAAISASWQNIRPAAARSVAEARFAKAEPDASSHVPGPFRASYPSGFAAGAPSARPDMAFASGGFRPRAIADIEAESDDQAVCREPQSLVVTTIIVGVLLAVMGYILDIR